MKLSDFIIQLQRHIDQHADDEVWMEADAGIALAGDPEISTDDEDQPIILLAPHFD